MSALRYPAGPAYSIHPRISIPLTIPNHPTGPTGPARQNRRRSGVLRVCIAIAVCLPICGACSMDEDASLNLRIVAYNAQNLFDDVLKGNEYDEFKPGQGKWDSAAYHTRLERMARTLYALGKTDNRDPGLGPVYQDPGDTEPGEIARRTTAGAYPDIVVMEEIESQKVIDDLVRDHLPAGTYAYSRVQDGDGGLIHIALLSKVPVVELASHKIWVDGESSRAVWEIGLDLPRLPATKDLVLFANHWKSKSGGESEGEGLRIAAAHIIEHRARTLLDAQPGLPLIVMGDLNETILPGSQAPKRRALGSWVAGAPDTTAESDSAVLRIALRDEVPAQMIVGGNGPDWISPWSDAPDPGGSYNYADEWEAIDHAFLSPGFFDGSGVEYQGFEVGAGDFLLDSGNIPYRYDAWTGKGFSDHLPIRVNLKLVPSDAP